MFEQAGAIEIFTPRSATAEQNAVSPEEHLLVRLRAGDEDAFNEFYRSFAPMVHGILLARVPYDEVKDLVQDVFLAAYKHIGSLRDPYAIGGWLAKIARNRASEHYRTARRNEELPVEIEGKNERRSEAGEILAIILSLPETYKETLILRLVEGMSGKEIASRTGLKPESVRVNLHRGMEMLRAKLGIAAGVGK